MSSPHVDEYFLSSPGKESVYTVNAAAMKFGNGALGEVGQDAKTLGLQKVGVFIDSNLEETDCLKSLLNALQGANLDYQVFANQQVEPTDVSIQEATQFALDGAFDGFISLGGGSVMDTAKAANLFSCYPDDVMAYVNAPIGQGKAVPGKLKPHIACPTTCGTGAETTGIIVFDITAKGVKTGIASTLLKPTMAIVDPTTTYTLPGGVVASTAFDVLTHAIESYTAISFAKRTASEHPSQRPPYQGANPYSDIGALEAIRIGGRSLVDGVNGDKDARDQLMFAATLAGMAFGSAGVHIPHALSYPIATTNHKYVATGYEKADPMVPHGIAVVMTAPATFRLTAPACLDRHLKAAEALGADISNVSLAEAGECLANQLISLMKQAGLANGLAGLGFNQGQLAAMAQSGFTQKRPLAQAPIEVTQEQLEQIYQDAMSYW